MSVIDGKRDYVTLILNGTMNNRYKSLNLVPYLPLLFILLGGCDLAKPTSPIESGAKEVNGSPKIQVDSDHHYFHDKERPHSAQWSYEGDNGPEYWGSLAPEYTVANRGRRQSPIDIHDALPAKLPLLNFQYKPAKIALVYNGHTIQETEEHGSWLHVESASFELKQFHFHSPSEHTINGQHFEMEVHLVHRSDDGQIAVVGVLVRVGQANSALDELWSYLPTEKNKRSEYNSTFNAISLLPDDRSYVSYNGSLTTPPCTEGIDWFVLTTPIELSRNQIMKFRQILSSDNNRPIQHLFGRQPKQSK